MIQRIHCEDCVQLLINPRDEAEGWKQRVRWVVGKMPEGHAIKTTEIATGETTVHPLSNLHCDLCNKRLPNATPIACVTQWRDPEPEPQAWEHEYGEEIKK